MTGTATISAGLTGVISTHTLTWSVTGTATISAGLTGVISTHTLTWSVTHSNLLFRIYDKNFNSHAHVERDCFFFVLGCYTVYFNSHAHVERDEKALFLLDHLADFNSHAHVERDICHCRFYIFFVIFQLTRSRGA